ncbi:MAG TPA: tail fiber protein [Pyrinomonadaceae bacterium]|jgi:microcystin-dependent protein
MTDQFIAEIRIFAGNFAPTGWALCNGQLIPISQNTALFSLLGTFYGGDGKSTFALPNMQGSAPMMWGQGNGLSLRSLGEQSGSQFVTLLQSEIPVHTHTVLVGNNSDSPSPLPTNNSLNRGSAGNPYVPASANPPLGTMSPLAVSIAGGSLPHNNMMPYLVLNFIIAMQGIFPPRT